LLEPLIDRLLSAEAQAAQEIDGDGEAPDWLDELARQRQSLRATASTPPELDSLRAWRAEVARAARIEPESVLPDHVLARVAAEHPADVEALGSLRGVGPILAQRFGEQILSALSISDVA
jgi:ATP-dependent DNA helicase RecQ